MHLPIKVSVAKMLYAPVWVDHKMHGEKITMVARSNHVVIMLPLWVDHNMQYDSVWGHVLG